MFNLTKKYPELLDLAHYSNDRQRNEVLKAIYERDIEDNLSFKFRGKRIYPIKDDGVFEMARELMHLTCKEIEEEGMKHRVFDSHRSRRLHWIKPHMEEITGENDVEVFSIIERNQKNRMDITRTYIYNKPQKYVIVLEPQVRCGNAYYLLTAYYLDENYGEKLMKKKLKKRLQEVL